MSDNITWQENLKISYQIHVCGESSFHYIGEQRSGQYFVLKISNKVLLKWRELKDTVQNVSYLDLLALSAVKLPISVKPDADRVEECIRTTASIAYHQSKGLRGCKRVNFLAKTRSVKVFLNELLNVSSLQTQLNKCEEDKKELQNQLWELDNRCAALLQELLSARDEINILETEADQAFTENKELTEYIKHIEETLTCSNCSTGLENAGQPINEVGERQRRRIVRELKTQSERALWFLESFGFKLDSVKVKDVNGKITEIDYKEGNGKRTFDQLPDEERDTIRAILYIMDTYCIVDSAYHEMSVLIDGLPRSYLIKQCRSSLNSICHISRTPGKNPGAQMSFKEELQSQIRMKVYLLNRRHVYF